MSPDRHGVGRVLGALALAVVAAACTRTPPDAPAPVAWDRQDCAHCRMLLSEPRHAAQLVTSDADVFHFDDPGCLFQWLDAQRPNVHRLWFHGAGDTWIDGRDVAFVGGHTTPMGSGLAAVPRDTPGALSLDAARARAARHHEEHHP